MALLFEVGAVLSSTDGVSFGKEEIIPEGEREIEGQKKKKANPWAEEGSGQCLAEQLAANKEKQDAAWKEAHNPFKPPAGMDEDEFEFFAETQAKKEEQFDMKRRQQELDFKEYTTARMSKVVKKANETVATTFENLLQEEAKAEVAPAPVKMLVKKKKKDKKDKKDTKDKKKKKEKHKGSQKESGEDEPSSKRAKTEVSEGLGGLLGSYGADDSD